MKYEQYGEMKAPRIINGRVDFSKIIFGPLVKSLEKVIYKLPFFVKNIPVADRPSYILRNVSGSGRTVATDYSSYEASFTPLYCLCIEYEIYAYFSNGWLAQIICKSFYLFNTSIFAQFRIRILAKRMSGDVNTSLGNGVSNLVTIQFIVWTKTHTWLFEIVIEGDDSLFNLPLDIVLTSSDFAEYGLKVKIEESHYPNLASFCGNIFDLEDLDVLVDPGRIFRRFGFIDVRYKNAKKSKQLGLLRAYAFSIYYMYHGCPMVSALARYLLRVTRGVYAKMDTINMYKFAEGETIPATEERMFALFPPNDIGFGSRKVISLLYGYSIDEQLEVESMLDSLNTIQPIKLPIIINKSHPDTIRYFNECKVHSGEDVTKFHPPPRVPFSHIVSVVNDNISRASHGEVFDCFEGLRGQLAMA